PASMTCSMAVMLPAWASRHSCSSGLRPVVSVICAQADRTSAEAQARMMAFMGIVLSGEGEAVVRRAALHPRPDDSGSRHDLHDVVRERGFVRSACSSEQVEAEGG